MSHSVCEGFAQSSPNFPRDVEQTGCVMEQEHMSQLVVDCDCEL